MNQRGLLLKNRRSLPLLLLGGFWAFGIALFVFRYLMNPDDPTLMGIERYGKTHNGELADILELTALEVLVSVAILRPWSYWRSWGRALAAAVVFAPWLVARAGIGMHGGPTTQAHTLWLLLFLTVLVGTAIVSGISTFRARASGTPSTLIGILILSLSCLAAGCNSSGPASTETNSTAFATVAERATFLHGYVTFRRTYETLDFDIMYHDNSGGMPPGPSDWDVRLVATVPASEIQAWVPAGVTAASAPDSAWLESVPTALDLSGVSEWYRDGQRVVGIDRARRIVVYRVSTM